MRAPAVSAAAPRPPVWRRWARLWPLTSTGGVLALLGALAFAFGRTRMDFVLTLAALVWWALLAVSGLAAALAGALLGRDARRAGRAAFSELRTVEGARTASGLRLPARRLPFAAQPLVRWIAPPATAELAEADGERCEFVVFSDRARALTVTRVLVQEDWLGLWRVRRTISAPGPALVLPDLGRLSAAELSECLASGDLLAHPFGPSRGDLVDHRTYTRSDPARLILWKVYARTRHLFVRAPEQARSPESQPLVFLVSGPGDGAAAAVVRLLIETGALGPGARFAADGAPTPVTDADAALVAVAASVQRRHCGGLDLSLAVAHQLVGPDDPIVVVAPAQPGPWVAPVLRVVGERPERFVVLGAGDAGPRETEPSRWRRLIFAAPPAAAPTLPHLARAMHPFLRLGARVALAERRTGRVWTLGGEAPALDRELARG